MKYYNKGDMMKKKFKVVGDSKNSFNGIELDIVAPDVKVGATFHLLGSVFTVTQIGKILNLVEDGAHGIDTWVLSIMDVTPEVVKEDEPLTVNKDFDIYFETKEIQVRKDCTYEQLFYALHKEWKLINKIPDNGFGGPLPFDYSERKRLFIFLDGWNFDKEFGFKCLHGGSYMRYESFDQEGKVI